MRRLAALAILALVGCGSADGAPVAAARVEPSPVATADAATPPDDAPDAGEAPDAAIDEADAAAPIVVDPDPTPETVDAAPPPVEADAAPPVVVDAGVDAAPPPPATVNVCVLDAPYLLPDVSPPTTLRQVTCAGTWQFFTDIDPHAGTASLLFQFKTTAQADGGPYSPSTRCDLAACEPGNTCAVQSAAHVGRCVAVPR